MLGNAHFYNRTIRKVVTAFGTVFNDILLQRYNLNNTVKKEIFKVPLSYGAKEKYLTRITSDPTLTKAVNIVVPRISFEMVSMTYDTSRKLNSLIRNFAANTSTSIKTQFNPIPYNFDFNLSIYVRNTEDGTQILEQILPFFTPDFTVTVNFISEMNQKYDMPIILNSVQSTVDYEGDMMSTRLIMWDLQFTAKGYIWPPVKSGKYIRQANTNIYIESQAKSSQQVTTESHVYAKADVYAYYSSDPILKENKELIDNPLDKICKLGGYSFDWKESAKEHGEHLKGKDYGIMADEVQSLFPELVQTRDNGIRAVKYDKLVPLLIE